MLKNVTPAVMMALCAWFAGATETGPLQSLPGQIRQAGLYIIMDAAGTHPVVIR